ncbi:uncharacterized protein C1orf158-like [Actinia tenebrosa]|uniref:Uncharacterized protein C1orf158-like n=1 Tax=Actinia tenebrosa TaxID=6105 RepID=A0A6P8HQC8_ACTTE|nr:uncharacterized protein C1orf158-like [Actinia tenebrosa]
MRQKKEKRPSTGWKIQPKYIEKVLIGNWFEEREQLYRKHVLGSTEIGQSGYIKPIPSLASKFPTRKELALRNWEGIGRRCLSYSDEYKPNLITSHVVDYQEPMQTPPTTIRKWNSRKSLWLPEKLDRPAEGIQLPRLLNSKVNPISRNFTSQNENTPSTKKHDDNQCPPINMPQTYKHEPVVIKYRHRKSDVTPIFPVILRNTSKRHLVVKWNM